MIGRGLYGCFLKPNPAPKLLNMHNKDQQRMLFFKDWKTENIQSID